MVGGTRTRAGSSRQEGTGNGGEGEGSGNAPQPSPMRGGASGGSMLQQEVSSALLQASDTARSGVGAVEIRTVGGATRLPQCSQWVSATANGISFDEWYTTKWMPQACDQAYHEAVKMLRQSTAYREADDEGQKRMRADAFTKLDEYMLLTQYVADGDAKSLAMAAVARLGSVVRGMVRPEVAMETFTKELKNLTGNAGMQQALYVYVTRRTLLEHASAFSNRFEAAAKAQDYPPAPRDANPRFYTLLTVEWSGDHYLREELDGFKAATFELRTDATRYRFSDLAAMAAPREDYARLQHANKAMMEDPRGSTGFMEGGGARRGRGKQPTGTMERPDVSHLPLKELGGREYPACGPCYAVGKGYVWHAPRRCPVTKALEQAREAAGDKGGQSGAITLVGLQEQPRGGGGRFPDAGGGMQCYNCGQRGHVWYKCNVKPLKPDLQARQDAWVAKQRGGGTAMHGAADHSASHGEGSIHALEEQAAALMAAAQRLKAAHSAHGAGSSRSHIKGADGSHFMAVAGREDRPWLRSSSSSGSSMYARSAAAEMAHSMASLLHRPADGDRVVYAGEDTPAHQACVHVGKYLGEVLAGKGQPAVRVSARTRAQQRMQRPEHDMERADRARRPVGFLNPVDEVPEQRTAQLVPPRYESLATTIDTVQMRHVQLVHLLRTCLEHVQLNVQAVHMTGDGPYGPTSWVEARDLVLRGHLDVERNPCVVQWDAAMRKVMQRFHSEAQVQWHDLLYISWYDVVSEAVRAVFGAAAVPPRLHTQPATAHHMQSVLPMELPMRAHGLRVAQPGAVQPEVLQLPVEASELEHMRAHAMRAAQPHAMQPPVVPLPVEASELEHMRVHAMRAAQPHAVQPPVVPLPMEASELEHMRAHAMRAAQPHAVQPPVLPLPMEESELEHMLVHAMRAHAMRVHAMRAAQPHDVQPPMMPLPMEESEFGHMRAHAMRATQPHDVQPPVMPLPMEESEQPAYYELSNEELRAQRERVESYIQSHPVGAGRGIATIDATFTNVRLNGFHDRLMHTLMDTGCDNDMVHRRWVERLRIKTVPSGVFVMGINGERREYDRALEPILFSLNPGTSWEMSTQLGKPVSSDASMRVPLIMDGEGLPDVILCNDTLARLYVNIDTVAWTATYANAPWSGCRLPLPLQPNHDCMAADATTCGVSGGGGGGQRSPAAQRRL